MSNNVRVIHPSDFLRARADGQVDRETGKALLAKVAAVLADHGPAFLHKTAVLCPRERFDNARFFSLLAASHGFSRVRAFLAYEDAMEWLMAGDDA